MLINLIEIIVQCMHISNHLIYSKYVTILFVNYTSMTLKEKNEVMSFYFHHIDFELPAMSQVPPRVLLKDMA